jgi:peptide/nickel transport system substrate-binding protein
LGAVTEVGVSVDEKENTTAEINMKEVRMKKMRRWVVPAIAVIAVTALAACSAGTKSTANGSNSTLRVAVAEVTSNLDPALYNVPANYITIAGTAGYLVTNPYKAFPYPSEYKGAAQVVNADVSKSALATSWKLSSDGLSLTMNLRTDAGSPSGHKLTAEDVVWTAKRDVALKTVGAFGMTVANIDTSNPVTATNSHTVVWHLTKPSPLLMKVLAWSWFAPLDSIEAKKHATSSDPWAQNWLKSHSDFYGPYTVTQFTPGQSATLSVNPNYWGAKPAIKTITMTSVPDAGTRQQLVQRGEVDLVPDLPRTQLTALQKSSSVTVDLQPSTRFSYLQYRAGVAPLDNKLVRQAISYAIPYSTILKDVYDGTALPAKTISTWLPNADPSVSPYSYDPKKAAALLAEAGYSKGFTVSLTYSVENPGPENEQVAILIADSLKKLGVTVNLVKPSSEAAFTTLYDAGQFQMALAGLSPGAPDDGYALFAMGATGGYQNFGKFSNADFDQITSEALSETNTTKRAALLTQANKLYEDLVPATPIADPLVGIATAKDVKGLKLGTWGAPVWQDMSISK